MFGLGNSFYTRNSTISRPFYLMDDVDCVGDEARLIDCDFSGWGVHNCRSDEVLFFYIYCFEFLILRLNTADCWRSMQNLTGKLPSRLLAMWYESRMYTIRFSLWWLRWLYWSIWWISSLLWRKKLNLFNKIVYRTIFRRPQKLD